MQKNFIIQNNQIGNGLFEDTITMQTQLFKAHDQAKLVSCRLNDLYAPTGTLFIKIKIQLKQDETLRFDLKNTPIYSYDDVYDQINNSILSEYIYLKPFIQNEQFVCSKLFFNYQGFDSEIYATGNLRNLLGLFGNVTRQELESIEKDNKLSENNSLRIKYIKIQCNEFNACEQTTSLYTNVEKNIYNKQVIQFETSTICVLCQSDAFQFQSHTLEVEFQILTNPVFEFRIVDQNNRPVKISSCVLNLLYSNFKNELQSSHSKRQCFMLFNEYQRNIQLYKTISKFAIVNYSGTWQPPQVLTKENAVLIIEDQEVNILDLQIFKEFENHYLDYNFYLYFSAFLYQLSNKQMQLFYNIDTNIISIKTKQLTAEGFVINAPIQSIFYNMLINNKYFEFDVIDYDEDQIKEVSYQLNPNMTFRYQNIYSIFQKDTIEILPILQSQRVEDGYSLSNQQLTSQIWRNQQLPIDIIHANNITIKKQNKAVWTWTQLNTPQSELDFKLKQTIETENLSQLIVSEQQTQYPNLILRVLVK